MPRSLLRRTCLACSVALGLMVSTSCSTGHLLRWSAKEPSMYSQSNDNLTSAVVRPIGTIVMLPFAIVFDVATFPFQWIWGVYPYGPELDPTIDRG